MQRQLLSVGAFPNLSTSTIKKLSLLRVKLESHNKVARSFWGLWGNSQSYKGRSVYKANSKGH